MVAEPAATPRWRCRPLLLAEQRRSVPVGETARLLVHSGLDEQQMVLEIFRDGRRIERRRSCARAAASRSIEIPIGEEHRGGFGVRLTAVRDHQLMTFASDGLRALGRPRARARVRHLPRPAAAGRPTRPGG